MRSPRRFHVRFVRALRKGFYMNGPEGKYAWTVKMGEKGQIVIPKEAREIFGFKPGDTLLVLGDIERGLAIVNNEELLNVFEKHFE